MIRRCGRKKLHSRFIQKTFPQMKQGANPGGLAPCFDIRTVLLQAHGMPWERRFCVLCSKQGGGALGEGGQVAGGNEQEHCDDQNRQHIEPGGVFVLLHDGAVIGNDQQ